MNYPVAGTFRSLRSFNFRLWTVGGLILIQRPVCLIMASIQEVVDVRCHGIDELRAPLLQVICPASFKTMPASEGNSNAAMRPPTPFL